MTAETTNPAPQTPESAAASPRLFRSRTDRMFAGVCGGIAETYGSDPTAVRLLAAILGVLTGILPMLLVYAIAAVVIPVRGEGDPITTSSAGVRVDARGPVALIVGVVLILGGLAALANEVFAVDWEMIWPVALVAIGGLIVVAATRR
jgi:phage shock protein C